MPGDFEAWYTHIASTISYYDFRFPEFEAFQQLPARLTLGSELSARQNWTEQELSSFLQRSPELIFLVETAFRESRFRNGQWIHFLFDVGLLNQLPGPESAAYVADQLSADKALKSIFDAKLSNLGRTLAREGSGPDLEAELAVFKQCLLEYFQDRGAVANRIQGHEDVRHRIATYLLKDVRLNEFLSAVNLRAFLGWKTKQKDIKSLHGKFGQERVESVLREGGFNRGPLGPSPSPYSYEPQAKIPGILTKSGRAKVFDFILSHNGRRRWAIETNFYESEGTKIGINVGEYIDLYREVGRLGGMQFAWVTDGPVWLTPGRKRTLEMLYGTMEGHIYNYNTFGEGLERVKMAMASQ